MYELKFRSAPPLEFNFPIMNMKNNNLASVERRLDEIQGELRAIRNTFVAQRSWAHRAFDWLRNNYGVVGFLLVGCAAGYYAVRYQVTPFHDLADPARSRTLARTYTTLGDRMMAVGRWDRAREAFGQALELDPRDARASYHAHIARLMRLDDPTAVDAALAQLAAEADDDPVIPFAQGILRARRKQHVEAAEFFRRSIRADPTFIGARINLGVVSFRTGDRNEYEKQAVEAYRLDSGFTIAINNMAYARELRHDFREATRLYLRMDTLDRSALTEWLVGASMLYHKPTEAEAHLGTAVSLLESGLPDTAAALGGPWKIGYVPADTAAQLSEDDVVTVTARREKLGCALVAYALYDALAHNAPGADAKLRRADTLLAGNRPLLRVIALGVESLAVLAPCDSITAARLHRAAAHFRELP